MIYICIKLQFGSWCFNCSKFWLFLRDATCGKLFCNGGSDYLPWKGRIVTILTCRLFDPEDSSEEIGIVINGTKCGDKKVSWNCSFYSECSFCLFFCFVYFLLRAPLCFMKHHFQSNVYAIHVYMTVFFPSVLFNKYLLCA